MTRRHLRKPSGPGLARGAAIGFAAACAVTFSALQARAGDPWFGKPSGTVTETSVIKYHFDNRNNLRDDDNYGEWLNRLNLQGTSGRFTLAFRLDSAMFFHTPDPNDLARKDLQDRINAGTPPPNQAQYKSDRTRAIGADLSDRYITKFYPSKYNITYQHRGLEVTAGDYYVQFGKGLVLAIRKIDELASDTTLRGGKIVYNPDLGGTMKLNVTAVAGATNPIRIDEIKGRLLSQKASTPWEKVGYPGMPGPNKTSYVQNPEPNFAADVIYGGQIEGGHKHLLAGVRAVQLERAGAPFHTGSDPAGPSRTAGKIAIGSVSLNAPSILEHATFYAEFARQSMTDLVGTRRDDPTGGKAAELARLSDGYAAYALATVFGGPITVSLEGKHYDRFYPMLANVGGSGVLDFSNVQYNIPPTTDPFTADFHYGSYNVCVTGGRARVDARVADNALFYASVGRYASWGVQSTKCGQETRAGGEKPVGKTDAIRNDITDPFVGTELNFEQARSHVYASTGVHFDDTAVPRQYLGPNGQEVTSSVFYRENWVRYSLLKKVRGPWSLEMTGWHRYRYNPGEKPLPWREGENYLSVIWSPKLTVAAGYEYSTIEQDLKHYFNGMVQWRFTGATFVRAFVGQSRPALRCISGVCKQFPAFEGARIEATVAF